MQENNKMPYFTVIVPIYNVEKYLEKCLNSIRNQTFEDFEVILIDDGSPDRCPQICDQYPRMDERFSVVHKTNEGLQRARRTGVQKAKGKYVAFVDSDDWVDCGWLEFVFHQLNRCETDILILGYKQDFADKTIRFENKVWAGLYEEENIREQLWPHILGTEKCFEFGIAPSLWSKIFKRELILEVIECVDEKLTLGEDAACTYLCIYRAKSIYICNNAFYHYRYVSDSMAQKYDPRFWENAECLFDFFDKNQEKILIEQSRRYKMYILLTGINKEFLYSPDLLQARHVIEEICSREKFAKVIREFECSRLQKAEKFIINALKKDKYGKLQDYFHIQRTKNKMKNIIKGIVS